MKSRRKFLKKTPWFVGVNPLRSRPGWYECGCGCLRRLYWDGEKWTVPVVTIAVNEFTWRGVQR